MVRPLQISAGGTKTSTGATVTTPQPPVMFPPSSALNVATVVAGPNLPATGAFVLQLHCHSQWHEGSHVETHNMLVSRKETCKIQSKPGLN